MRDRRQGPKKTRAAQNRASKCRTMSNTAPRAALAALEHVLTSCRPLFGDVSGGKFAEESGPEVVVEQRSGCCSGCGTSSKKTRADQFGRSYGSQQVARAARQSMRPSRAMHMASAAPPNTPRCRSCNAIHCAALQFGQEQHLRKSPHET